MNHPAPQRPPLPQTLPWVVGALVVVAAVAFAIWWTTPEEDALPTVYSVM